MSLETYILELQRGQKQYLPVKCPEVLGIGIGLNLSLVVAVGPAQLTLVAEGKSRSKSQPRRGQSRDADSREKTQDDSTLRSTPNVTNCA